MVGLREAMEQGVGAGDFAVLRDGRRLRITDLAYRGQEGTAVGLSVYAIDPETGENFTLTPGGIERYEKVGSDPGRVLPPSPKTGPTDEILHFYPPKSGVPLTAEQIENLSHRYGRPHTLDEIRDVWEKELENIRRRNIPRG